MIKIGGDRHLHVSEYKTFFVLYTIQIYKKKFCIRNTKLLYPNQIYNRRFVFRSDSATYCLYTIQIRLGSKIKRKYKTIITLYLSRIQNISFGEDFGDRAQLSIYIHVITCLRFYRVLINLDQNAIDAINQSMANTTLEADFPLTPVLQSHPVPLPPVLPHVVPTPLPILYSMYLF